MKRLIQERRKSLPQQPESDSSTNAAPQSGVDQIVGNAPPSELEEEESPLESSATSLHDVDDDTLQLFYFYYDKLKRSIHDSSGGSVRVPTKAELMEFVMHANNG